MAPKSTPARLLLERIHGGDTGAWMISARFPGGLPLSRIPALLARFDGQILRNTMPGKVKPERNCGAAADQSVIKQAARGYGHSRQ